MNRYTKEVVAVQIVQNHVKDLQEIPLQLMNSWEAGNDSEGFYLKVYGFTKFRNGDWVVIDNDSCIGYTKKEFEKQFKKVV